jgi:hypothetical protein
MRLDLFLKVLTIVVSVQLAQDAASSSLHPGAKLEP